MDTKRLVCTILTCVASLAAGDEFQANVRTAGNQSNVAITAQRSGRFAIVWSSYFSSGGRSNDVIARRFDANGNPAGEEFQVNATREGNQTEPALAVNGEGLLFAVWQGPGPDGDEDIFARVFSPDDEPITDEFRVGTHGMGRQLHPKVAACEDGTFVIVWENDQAGEAKSVYGRLFDDAGGAMGDEFPMDDGAWECRYPDVAMGGTGGFVTVWMQDRSNNTILARLFDPNGVATTEPFAVSTADIASVTHPSVAMRQSGDFVVVWDGDPDRASEDDIHARCFRPDGTPLSDPLLVNAVREGRQQWPQVALNETGEFIVVWQHEREAPDLATDIFARRFDLDSRPASSEFKLNGYIVGKQRYPDVALSGHGSAVSVWESDDQDGSGYGVFACVELVADLNADGTVDFRDFCLLGRSWRSNEYAPTGDEFADARGLKALFRYWLK